MTSDLLAINPRARLAIGMCLLILTVGAAAVFHGPDSEAVRRFVLIIPAFVPAESVSLLSSFFVALSAYLKKQIDPARLLFVPGGSDEPLS